MTTETPKHRASEKLTTANQYLSATPQEATRAHRIEIDVQPELLDADEALRKALVSLERANMAREAHFSWSGITACNRRVAQYLTSSFPTITGGSLLTKTLDRAFAAYARAEPGDRLAPLRAYFDSVLNTLEEVFAFQVFCRDGRNNTRRWVVLSSPLTEFVTAHQATQIIWFPNPLSEELSEDVRRGMIAACVLNYEQMVMIQRDRHVTGDIRPALSGLRRNQ